MSPVKQGLKCHPAQVPTSWKTLCKCSLPAPLNIAPAVSICLLCDDTNHSRWSGRNKLRDTSTLIDSPPYHLMLTRCSRLSCASKSRVLACAFPWSSGVHMLGACSALTQMLGLLHLSLVREGTGTNSCERGLQKGSTVEYLISWCAKKGFLQDQWKGGYFLLALAEFNLVPATKV